MGSLRRLTGEGQQTNKPKSLRVTTESRVKNKTRASGGSGETAGIAGAAVARVHVIGLQM